MAVPGGTPWSAGWTGGSRSGKPSDPPACPEAAPRPSAAAVRRRQLAQVIRTLDGAGPEGLTLLDVAGHVDREDPAPRDDVLFAGPARSTATPAHTLTLLSALARAGLARIDTARPPHRWHRQVTS